MTEEIAQSWVDVYVDEYDFNIENPSANGRLTLMRRCVALEGVTMKSKREIETKVRVANSQTDAMRLFLEPWGREYIVHPQDEFIFAFYATTPAQPEVILTADGVEVWAWSGATVEVFKNGVELTEYVREELPQKTHTSA